MIIEEVEAAEAVKFLIAFAITVGALEVIVAGGAKAVMLDTPEMEM